MITDTQPEVDQSPDDFLSQGLREMPGIDSSGYSRTQSDDNTALKTGTQDRGTADPDQSIEQQEVSQDTSNTSSTDALTAKTNAGKSKERANERIQELVAQIKERDAKLAEYEKAKLSAQNTPATQTQEASKAPEFGLDAQKPQEMPIMIPKPEFDVKTLEGLEKKYEDLLDEHTVNGDLPKIRETREILRNIRVKLGEAKTWEDRNKSTVEKHNAAINHYRNQIVEKWPEMRDEKSPIRQEYGKVHARFVELQNNPALLEYELASLASLRLAAAKASALEEQLKKIQQENALLKEKQKPLSQTEATSAGRSNENDDPDDFLRRGLKDFGFRTTR